MAQAICSGRFLWAHHADRQEWDEYPHQCKPEPHNALWMTGVNEQNGWGNTGSIWKPLVHNQHLLLNFTSSISETCHTILHCYLLSTFSEKALKAPWQINPCVFYLFRGYSGKGIKTLIQNIHQHLQLYALSLWTIDHNIVTGKQHIWDVDWLNVSRRLPRDLMLRCSSGVRWNNFHVVRSHT